MKSLSQLYNTFIVNFYCINVQFGKLFVSVFLLHSTICKHVFLCSLLHKVNAFYYKHYTTVGCTPPIRYSFLLLGRLSRKPNQTLRPATFDVIKIIIFCLRSTFTIKIKVLSLTIKTYFFFIFFL